MCWGSSVPRISFVTSLLVCAWACSLHALICVLRVCAPVPCGRSDESGILTKRDVVMQLAAERKGLRLPPPSPSPSRNSKGASTAGAQRPRRNSPWEDEPKSTLPSSSRSPPSAMCFARQASNMMASTLDAIVETQGAELDRRRFQAAARDPAEMERMGPHARPRYAGHTLEVESYSFGTSPAPSERRQQEVMSDQRRRQQNGHANGNVNGNAEHWRFSTPQEMTQYRL